MIKDIERNLYVFGVSTTAQAIHTFVCAYNLFKVKAFVIDDIYKTNDQFCGLPVLGIKKDGLIDNFDKEKDYLFVAIQWNKLNADRRNVYERFKNFGYSFANIIAPSAIIHGKLQGENCWISDLVVVDTNSIIGTNVFVKTKAFIGNDCHIGDHSFIGASSFIAGDCVVDEQVFVGIRATIFDNIRIGKKSIIGACAIVKRNVDDYTLVKTVVDQKVKTYDAFTIESKLIYNKNIR